MLGVCPRRRTSVTIVLPPPGDVPTLRPAHADPACASKFETSTLRSESYRRVEDLDLDISRDVTEQISELRCE
jgi:hypothetical protein